MCIRDRVGVLGELSLNADRTRLIFTSSASTFCGTNRHTIIQDPTDGIAAFRVVCDDVQTAGISISEDNLAVIYDPSATPFDTTTTYAQNNIFSVDGVIFQVTTATPTMLNGLTEAPSATDSAQHTTLGISILQTPFIRHTGEGGCLLYTSPSPRD